MSVSVCDINSTDYKFHVLSSIDSLNTTKFVPPASSYFTLYRQLF
jgi:hypothetical protein